MKSKYIFTVILFVLLTLPLLGDGPNFRADVTVNATSTAGWHPLGAADWKAQNGEIVGTPKQPGGGWLVLDKSLQDVAFYADMNCAAGCKAGVLLRTEKTPDGGMKGIFVSFSQGDTNSYAVTLDSQGKELTREKLPPATGQITANGIPRAGLATAATPGNARASGPPPIPANVPPSLASRPRSEYREGDWNEIQVILAGTAVRPILNGGTFGGGGAATGDANEKYGKYGPVALYVGGEAPVRFKNIAYKNLLARSVPSDSVSSNYKMQRLSEFYYSWSAAIADVNHDGIADVVAGPFYYLGPKYDVANEFYPVLTWDPSTQYALDSMVSMAYDFTGDGWADVLIMSGSAGNGTGTLYVNPHGEARRWDHYVVIQPVGNEETLMKDVDGDGKPEIVHCGNNTLQYSKPDPAKPTERWITKTVSEPGPWCVNISHGLGVGDINGDGRMDALTAYGWFEQPPAGAEGLWTYHPEAFGRWGRTQGGAGGAELAVYDVNGDKLNDVVSTLEGHGFGMAWFEQKRDAGGKISFVQHMIMDNFTTKNAGGVIFTEPHASTYADMDGDGIPDFITGKRYMSHLATYGDPDPYGEPVLYVYHTVRNPKAPGGAEFVPELIHNRSGVGSHFAVADLNGDGKPDIATSTASGTFIFFNNTKAAPKAQAAARR